MLEINYLPEWIVKSLLRITIVRASIKFISESFICHRYVNFISRHAPNVSQNIGPQSTCNMWESSEFSLRPIPSCWMASVITGPFVSVECAFMALSQHFWMSHSVFGDMSWHNFCLFVYCGVLGWRWRVKVARSSKLDLLKQHRFQ